jgi:hypothetical protein
MIPKSHLEAPAQTVEAQDIRFAYRRLGKSTGTPLLLIRTTGAEWTSGIPSSQTVSAPTGR